MADYVAIDEGDISSIVRSVSFSSSVYRDLVESALLIVLRNRRSQGVVNIGYFEEALKDISHSLVSSSVAGRVLEKIEQMYKEQQEEKKAA